MLGPLPDRILLALGFRLVADTAFGRADVGESLARNDGRGRGHDGDEDKGLFHLSSLGFTGASDRSRSRNVRFYSRKVARVCQYYSYKFHIFYMINRRQFPPEPKVFLFRALESWTAYL